MTCCSERIAVLKRPHPAGICLSSIAALILFFVAALPVHANSVSVDLSATFQGTGACGSSPCETFNISFQVNANGSLVPGSMDIQSSGPFGSFQFDGLLSSSKGTLMDWSDKQGLLLVFATPCTTNQLTSGCSFNPDQVFLTCVTQACASDFGINLSKPFLSATTASLSDPIAAPEPSIDVFLFCGFLCLAVSYPWLRRGRLLAPPENPQSVSTSQA